MFECLHNKRRMSKLTIVEHPTDNRSHILKLTRYKLGTVVRLQRQICETEDIANYTRMFERSAKKGNAIIIIIIIYEQSNEEDIYN